MLKRFSVLNFKNYNKKLEFHLDQASNYEFNSNVVHNNIITKAIIYGINGSGKSNFCLALFDIIYNLTEKEKLPQRYNFYLNYNSNKPTADFEYEFVFNGIPVIYKYSKTDVTTLTAEALFINGEEVLNYDFSSKKGYTTLKGTIKSENLTSQDEVSNRISKVKIIKGGSLLEDNETNRTLQKFFDYVDNMLMFFSLDTKGYQGLNVGIDSITRRIIAENKLSDFELFLKDNNLNYTLIPIDGISGKEIYCMTPRGPIPFWEIASTGTKSLALFYYWLLQMKKTSLVVVDEYDAFYHYELAEKLVKKVKEYDNVQIIFTTHNTDLLSNDLLRPDAYFIIQDNSIKALSDCTQKDLRYAHNLQKMYKAGAFKNE